MQRQEDCSEPLLLDCFLERLSLKRHRNWQEKFVESPFSFFCIKKALNKP